jgi:RHS repeat-associated protein
MGEKLSANPLTGTASATIPIAASPGRSGFGPQLALSYNSAGGNGPFGFGWALSLPSVTRRTDQGLPRYDPSLPSDHQVEPDVFVLSGAEDLVPMRDADAGWARVTRVEEGYRVDRYRPRVEGLFARIERWTRLSDGEIHWRSVSQDNVTTLYGEDDGARIADPQRPERVFSWLISRTWDDKGNAIVYEYVTDNGAGVDTAAAHERNRTDATRATNRYLKRVRYGNRVSNKSNPGLTNPQWMFEVVFDYGDHDPDVPQPSPDRPWPCRTDAFSSYRAGFEVRTYRLCRRALLFHHFPDEPGVGADCLIRSTTFTHTAGEAIGQFLTAAVHSGHRRVGVGYVTGSLPPVEFTYSTAVLHDEVREVDTDSLAGAPSGLAGVGYGLVDLDGEGLAGILAEQASSWFYKSNRGDGRFGPARPVVPVPSLVGAGRTHQLLDLAGDGQLDLVDFGGPTPGFFAHRERDWAPFVAFATLPAVDWDDTNLRFVDLDGDGHADVLVAEENAFTWYPSLAEAGFGPAVRVSLPGDDETGPRLVFADGTRSVHLADMSGDGLTDLVRIRNGEVCYWPNLGYGRFGAKVVMDGAPRFDRDELFDAGYLRLADVDGSGVTDLLYLGPDGVRIYLNRNGNSFAEPRLIATAPRTDGRTQVTAVDLLGTGTTCLVWSSARPDDARRAIRFIDLLGSTKPHLLVRMANNLGAETLVRYAPSTRFYLDDAAAGRPWLTRLPFPVHVVERVETRDRISGNRFVTRYAYHHGYFDGDEREFRGFGMVERWDSEELAALGEVEEPGFDAASHVPPVRTRTWYHTGFFIGHTLSRQFENEYWREPGLTPERERALLVDDTVWPDTIRRADGTGMQFAPSGLELREACRALKGSVLREEVYADDGSDAAERPYQVSERNYTVELLQPRLDGDRHAVCLSHSRESVVYRYERALYEVAGATVADPRVSHEVVLDVDGFGNPVRTVSVAYPRRHPGAGLHPDLPAWALDAIRTEQSRLHATLTVHAYTHPTDVGPAYRGPLPSESSAYELVAMPGPAVESGRLGYGQLRALADAASDGAHDLPYHDVDGAGATGNGPWRRLIERMRTRYQRDDLAGPLPPGQAGALALPYENHRLAFPTGLLPHAYHRTVDGIEENLLPDPATMLGVEGGYVSDADGWWIPSGRPTYAADRFFLPVEFRDPFGNVSRVDYDQYHLHVRESRDPLDNRTTVAIDYRVLQPSVVTDPNGNRSAVAFDAFGLVVGMATMGKQGENVGDSLDGFAADLPSSQVQAHLADPLADPQAVLDRATSRTVHDLFAFHATRDDPHPRPPVVAVLARESHDKDLAPGEKTRIQHTVSYSDGFGREIQRKVLAEPGPLVDGGPDVTRRWVGTGWTVFNNKGNPVREYEPFFTDTHNFENEKVAGVSSVLFYDPVERVIATLAPDDTYAKEVYDPWSQASWDGNDTVLLDPASDPDVGGYLGGYIASQAGWQSWHARRQAGALGTAEKDAATKAAVHGGTQTVAYGDTLGRAAVTVAHNRSSRDGAAVEQRHATRVVHDLENNILAVMDALGRVNVRYAHSMTGARIHVSSMDTDQRWTLDDVAGKPLYGWDARGNRLRTSYDQLRRSTGAFLRGAGQPETVTIRWVYGEGEPDADAANLRGRPVRVFDAAGVLTTDRYDFKGNQLRSSRRFAEAFEEDPDWSGPVPLEAAEHVTQSEFDALDRTVAVTTPDGSLTRYRYNEAGLLDRVEVNLRGEAQATVIVSDIAYDAKGRRTLVALGNGVRTTYEYDPLTFRLARLRSQRGGQALQDLAYTYDPVGNPCTVHDGAQQSVFFNNQLVDAHAGFTYDAVYRLTEASGREHLGQNRPPGPDDAPRVGLPHPGDGAAMARYVERYDYDEVSNLLAVIHRGTDPAQPGWTREYDYVEPSRIDPAVPGNRLTRTRVGTVVAPCQHDTHGNMTGMPGLPMTEWGHRDHLRMSSRQVVVDGTPETTWYVYDAAGNRVRKVTRRQSPAGSGPRKEEARYLGGVEIHREYAGDGTTVILERETLHVLDGDRRVAVVETRTQGTDPGPARLLRYQLGNHLGTATVELDDAGQVISYEEFHPYGSTAYQGVRSATEAPKRYRYTGKERDRESGLYYHGARYFAPWLGRWTSADPAGLVDGTNLYAYAQCRPTRLIDPTGTQGEGSVLNAVDSTLVQKGIGYNTEITVRIKTTAPDGTTAFVTRRYDRAYYQNGELVLLEGKGSNLSGEVTQNQAVADSWVQKRGGEATIIKSSGAPPPGHGAQKSDLSFNKGQTVTIKPGNVKVVTGKISNGGQLASEHMEIGAWKGQMKSLPNIPEASDPNMVRVSEPGKPPRYVPRSQVQPGKPASQWKANEPEPTPGGGASGGAAGKPPAAKGSAAKPPPSEPEPPPGAGAGAKGPKGSPPGKGPTPGGGALGRLAGWGGKAMMILDIYGKAKALINGGDPINVLWGTPLSESNAVQNLAPGQEVEDIHSGQKGVVKQKEDGTKYVDWFVPTA